MSCLGFISGDFERLAAEACDGMQSGGEALSSEGASSSRRGELRKVRRNCV